MRVAAHACRCIIVLHHARGVGEEMQAIQQKPKEPETSGAKRTLTLFCILFKIGLFSFGGGWSIIAQMETEFIQKRHWITQEELLDQVAIGRSLPGIMIINIAVLFGCKMGGVLCAMLCAVAIALPSILVLSVVTVLYSSFRDNAMVDRALIGVRAAVVPIILSAIVKLKKTAVHNLFGYLLATAALVLCLFFNVNNVLVVLLGAAVGLLWRRFGRGKDEEVRA